MCPSGQVGNPNRKPGLPAISAGGGRVGAVTAEERVSGTASGVRCIIRGADDGVLRPCFLPQCPCDTRMVEVLGRLCLLQRWSRSLVRVSDDRSSGWQTGPAIGGVPHPCLSASTNNLRQSGGRLVWQIEEVPIAPTDDAHRDSYSGAAGGLLERSKDPPQFEFRLAAGLGNCGSDATQYAPGVRVYLGCVST